uniref:Uncharacterized protein n=1 Tax=Caenorhabditis tropicalis TaxID=1561998 RepID=A0A1I7TKT5_9PELO
MSASPVVYSLLAVLLPLVNVLEAAVWEVDPTFVSASGVLTCEHYHEREWCFRIVLLEIDTFSNDLIDEYGAKCTESETFNYHLSGRVYGDGFKDNFYEFQLWLYHNCSEHGSIRKQIHQFDEEPVSKK